MLDARVNSIKARQARRQVMEVALPSKVRVVKVQVPGIQGPEGKPGKDGKDGKDGNAMVDSIPNEQIKNLF